MDLPRILICTVGFSCFLPSISDAQKGKYELEFYGVVKTHVDSMLVPGVIVTLEENGMVLQSTTTQDSGKYLLNIPYRREFIVRFLKEGYLPRLVAVDTRAMWGESLGRHAMNVSMTLLPIIPGRDHSFAEQPCARAMYDRKAGYIVWDQSYSETIRPAIQEYLKPLN